MDDVFQDMLEGLAARLEIPTAVVAAAATTAAEPTDDEPHDSLTQYVRAVWCMLHDLAARTDRWVYLFGAGEHTKWALATTRGLPRSRFKGLLDDAALLPTRFGQPLQRPERTGSGDGMIILISSDRMEAELFAAARARFGDRARIVRLYDGLPPGPYPRAESPDTLARRREATRRARQRWGGESFVGPYERAGFVTGYLEEQWLWRFRDHMHGHVLDMSTPRYWHAWIHDLPEVDRVSISDLDRDVVMKAGYASRVAIRADFAAPNLDVPRGSLNTVLCLSVAEHCDNPRRLLANLHEVLAPGGTLLLSVPFACADGHCRPDYWRFCRDGLALLARQAGFGDVQTGSLGNVAPLLADLLGHDFDTACDQDGIPLINWLATRKAPGDG